MSKLPQVKPRILAKILLKKGFRERPTKGSHVVYIHPDGRRTTIAFHAKPIPKGTLRAILRQTDISVEDLMDLL
ncbi:type II toxin-antitoxin system HicA family toxin [Candidatus Gottesmanbacteria bacterium]|nr:type II toxin-antitoxin system HicA family toxin [Candidatus Gottesmanbacteria bacterium]MBI3559716.1 type II toxin-antitoxin system HicA family toxin [Candidatus Gottesmanbacteria bacterium]